jgi:predicted CXXCH cytochrome family protein
MRARWGAALAAAALAASADARTQDGSGPCELARADRTRATARDCMQCHDGSAGPGVGFQMSGDGHGMGHPVDVDYPSFAAAHSDQYQQAARLPREVVLVRGRIQCTTCHDGASRDPKRVVEVQDLCLACHKL